MFPNLKAEMARRDLTVNDVAQALNISRMSASERLLGRMKLSVVEAQQIRDSLFPDMELDYLFDIRKKES